MAEPILITAPAVEPISLAEARLHLRIDDDNTTDDALIELLITAAREQAEHELGRRLITQTWDMVLDAFPGNSEAIELHWDLVKPASIAQITYLDTSGVVQTMDPGDYELDPHSLPGYVFPAAGVNWPGDVADSANAVKVRVVCGFGAAGSDVPATIREWIKLQLGALYRNREAFQVGVPVAELPGRFTERLLDGHRVYRP